MTDEYNWKDKGQKLTDTMKVRTETVVGLV